jgi:hypothetical protein
MYYTINIFFIFYAKFGILNVQRCKTEVVGQITSPYYKITLSSICSVFYEICKELGINLKLTILDRTCRVLCKNESLNIREAELIKKPPYIKTPFYIKSVESRM